MKFRAYPIYIIWVTQYTILGLEDIQYTVQYHSQYSLVVLRGHGHGHGHGHNHYHMPSALARDLARERFQGTGLELLESSSPRQEEVRGVDREGGGGGTEDGAVYDVPPWKAVWKEEVWLDTSQSPSLVSEQGSRCSRGSRRAVGVWGRCRRLGPGP